MQVSEVSGSTTYVWISATGKKYHCVNDCGTMNPDKVTKLTEAEAISQGYSACKRCY